MFYNILQFTMGFTYFYHYLMYILLHILVHWAVGSHGGLPPQVHLRAHGFPIRKAVPTDHGGLPPQVHLTTGDFPRSSVHCIVYTFKVSAILRGISAVLLVAVQSLDLLSLDFLLPGQYY